jgi:hypothetical protein
MPKVKRTIPIATVSGRDAELSISTDDWKRIESSYGQDVPEIARKEIHGATLGFLLFVAFEPARRPVSESRDRISRLKEVAGAFQKAVFDNPHDEGKVSRTYADHLVRAHFEDTRFRDPDPIRSLGLVMTSLIVACNQALADLDDPKKDGPPKGETWRSWVRHLTKIAETHQLPTPVRKDTDKSAVFTPSPFVALIRELQALIPEAYRQSTHSDSALSEAIVRARRPRSGHKSRREPPE